MSKFDTNAYGLWKVTTEGDEEGRTTKDLGIYEGYLEDIAFKLSDSVYYTLRFMRIDLCNVPGSDVAPRDEVHVNLPIVSDTWNMKSSDRVSFFTGLLKPDSRVSVVQSKYHASVKLVRGRNPAEREQMRKESVISSALAKLSPEEKTALEEVGLLNLAVKL